MSQQYVTDADDLDQEMENLLLVITTGDAPRGDTDDLVCCNVVFGDIAELYIRKAGDDGTRCSAGSVPLLVPRSRWGLFDDE